jgi:uncharacterized protein (TIGR00251 family)
MNDSTTAAAYQVEPGRVRLAVRLTPNAARTAIAGVMRDAAGQAWLQVRVMSPPVEGAANAALIAHLAKALGLRKSDIRIVAGEAARNKRLALIGDPAAIAARLEEMIGVVSPRANR